MAGYWKSTALSLALLAAAGQAAAGQKYDYTSGLRAVKAAVADNDLQRADRVLKELLASFPKNNELLAMQARVLFWQKRYHDSADTFKKSLALKRDSAVEQELRRAETASTLADADDLLNRGETGKGEELLRMLFASGRNRYESGLRLGRLYLSQAKYGQALEVFGQGLKDFPRDRDFIPLYAEALLGAGDNRATQAFLESDAARIIQPADLAALRARVLFRQKQFAEATTSFKASLTAREDSSVRQELERSLLAETILAADTLIAAGKDAEAAPLLEPLYDTGNGRYDAGVRLAGILYRKGRFTEAAGIYHELAVEYPKEADFNLLYATTLVNLREYTQAMNVLNSSRTSSIEVHRLRGRIYELQGHLEAARAEYAIGLQLGADPELDAAARKLQALIDLQHAEQLVSLGEYRQAMPYIRVVQDSGQFGYESRLLAGRVYLAEKSYDEAVNHYRQLYQDYPQDEDIIGLYADALLLSGNFQEADRVLQGLSPTLREALLTDREELFYRAAPNWFRLSGGGYAYSNATRNESIVSATVSQRFGRFTAVSFLSETTRRRVTDPQFGIDLYSGKGENSPWWGMLTFSASPDANFLPKITGGGEAGVTLGTLDLSLGYNHLKFKDSNVNIMTIGGVWYIPDTPFNLQERVYLVPSRGTSMFLTTLGWEQDHRFKAFLTAGAGNSAEKISTTEDAAKFESYLFKGGAEYRFTPEFSIGAEGSHEMRRGLYDRSGGTAYVRYWWR